ncbi:MAG TPA: saccharopine dehydrogenase C-terminal domain-containing protein [Synergistaceae bacterium]|nr:saccharopine dehydrogenase C-terminal domain-containing protein [Synergistaceae bacterium]
MTQKILVFGAGRVARPCVQYLLRQGYEIFVADLSKERLDYVIQGNPRGHGIQDNAGSRGGEILRQISPDLVINLLPPELMPGIARECLSQGVHSVDPAYLDKGTASQKEAIREKGLVFISELGLDPGIDHMSAARTIAHIRSEGGKIRSFRSICGALPSAEANTNPWGYKLSWAPASLIGASRRTAHIKEKGQEILWPLGETYKHYSLEEIKGLGVFEVYANADSLPYLDIYGIPEAESIYRGTLRYPGWCETICFMNLLSLFDEGAIPLRDMSFRDFTASRMGKGSSENVEADLASFLKIPAWSAVLHKFRWLGLFDTAPIPFEEGSPRDVIAWLFDKKLVYRDNERDLVLLKDEILAEYPEGSSKKHESLLVDYGIPGGDSSIARTTGIPPAIGASLILQGKITTPGLHIPTTREIYEPLFRELEQEGIRLEEQVIPLSR